MTGSAPAVPRVRAGASVTLHLRLSLSNGFEVESTYGDEPFRFVVGDGTLAAGLEAALLGLAVGERRDVTLGPGTAFEYRDEAKVHTLPLGDFAAPAAVEVDSVIAFETPAGEEMPGRILKVEASEAVVDFNHPLAGVPVRLEAEILSVDAPAR
jgi:FKBP-type peptidyl-prolyl cis-trans isomerase 2